MKKIFILTLALMFVAALSFGAAKHKAAEKMIKGSVKTVTVADPAKGTKSEVTVVDEKSNEKIFLVKSTTTLYGKDFKAIGLDKIKPDDRIKVKYITTREGVREAVYINILK
jgi:hypothetical protein